MPKETCPTPIRKLLVAGRGEIAIRIMRAAEELGIKTVAIHSEEDRFSPHRFRADESYLVGEGLLPVSAYRDIGDIISIARRAGADAIHPGNGFMSENADFADACAANGIRFIGPPSNVLRTLGNKLEARSAAVLAGIPVMPATGVLPSDLASVCAMARELGYPLMLKACRGVEGRVIRGVETEQDLRRLLPVARRQAGIAFGNNEMYLEKLIRNVRHIAVQLFGDLYGNLVHLFERDCVVQCRHQITMTRAPAPNLHAKEREVLWQAALRLGRQLGLTHACTVEFLIDDDTAEFYFIEANPSLPPEHTLTEQVIGIDIAKGQIRVSEGARIGGSEMDGSGVPEQAGIRISGHALQCRVTTEDPGRRFTPDHGRITAYRCASGEGISLDIGAAYSGAVISPYYDSPLIRVTAWAPAAPDAVLRMEQALDEFHIRGVATNLSFLKSMVGQLKTLD